MFAVAVAAAATVTVAATETFKGRDWLSRWQSRGIDLSNAPSPWYDAGYAAAAAALSLLFTQSPLAVASIAAAAWLLAFSARSDMCTGRIPREPAWGILAVGIILAVATVSPAAIAAATLTFLIVSVIVALLLALTRGGLGSGDARLLLAVTPVAAFTGTIPFLLGLALASVTQLVLRFTGAAQPNGRGRVFAPALCFGLTAGWLWGLASDSLTFEWAGILPF